MAANEFFQLERRAETLNVALTGEWNGQSTAVISALREAVLESRGNCVAVIFQGEALLNWDSRLLVLIAQFVDRLATEDVSVEINALPEGIHSLVSLSRAVPARGKQTGERTTPGFLASLGQAWLGWWASLQDSLTFLGESLLVLWKFVFGRARFLRSDLWIYIQTTGPQALVIVGIINLLLGVILAFMGAVQLRQFGAEVFVADLVGLGQTREIAPMMTAIVMAGRTGAAYAAQLGTMQVNEEIDALRTFGFEPMEFLVLPRMVALALMFPLLVLYADVLGIVGGYLVGVAMLGLGTTEYIEQTRAAVGLGDIALGVFKGAVFGVLVAVTGCMKGMQSGRSASAVGSAATAAVVSGIVAIVVATALFAVVTNALGI